MSDIKRNINKGTGETPPAQKARHNTSSEVVPNVPAWPGASKETTSEGNATPVQRPTKSGAPMGGQGGIGSEPTNANNAGVDVSAMMDFLKLESQKRDQQHAQIVGSMDGLTNTVGDLQKSIELEKSTREKDIAEVKSQIADLQKRDEQLVEEAVKNSMKKMNLGNLRPPGINAGDAGHVNMDGSEIRKRQIIVSGLGDFEEAANMIAELERLTKRIVCLGDGCTFQALGRDSKLAMITFPSIPAKINFYKTPKTMWMSQMAYISSITDPSKNELRTRSLV